MSRDPVSGIAAVLARLREHKSRQALRVLCGEMSAREMETALALVSWMESLCLRHLDEALPCPAAPGRRVPDHAEIMAAIARARRSRPDPVSSAALDVVENQIADLFRMDDASPPASFRIPHAVGHRARVEPRASGDVLQRVAGNRPLKAKSVSLTSA